MIKQILVYFLAGAFFVAIGIGLLIAFFKAFRSLICTYGKAAWIWFGVLMPWLVIIPAVICMIFIKPVNIFYILWLSFFLLSLGLRIFIQFSNRGFKYIQYGSVFGSSESSGSDNILNDYSGSSSSTTTSSGGGSFGGGGASGEW